MRWKPIRFIPDGTKLPFMRWSRFGFFISGVLAVCAALLFATKGLNYGVDFKGGTVITIRTADAADLDKLRSGLNALGLGDVELQEFGSPRDVLIRMEAQATPDSEKTAQEKVRGELGPTVEVRSIEQIGPKVSNELSQQAIAAVLLSILFVLFYLWVRFEWQFAVGAVISLLHDTILSIGLFSLIGLEFNLNIIAAILTIIGYSLNDTVVVFDRIREFLRKYKTMHLADLIDFSINSVLPRTLLTSATLFIALLALYFFGGEVLHGFTFAMIWGVIVGTYSSIFVAAPVLILFGIKRDWSGDAARKSGSDRP
jgi:preprotein translocase SecF subunit